MDGFVRSVGASEPMGYYTHEVLPFAYSLASTFTIANRWFCSMPGPTYPNRRFLLAGTAYGGTTTGLATLLDNPPSHGTILGRLSEHHISWSDYFTDVPMTSVIPSACLKHLDHHHPLERFYHDCEAGTLPAVSFVDPGIGVLSSIASAVAALPSVLRDALSLIGANVQELPPKPRRTRLTCTTARSGRTKSSKRSFTRPSGSGPFSSTPTTSTAATTITCRRRPRRFRTT